MRRTRAKPPPSPPPDAAVDPDDPRLRPPSKSSRKRAAHEILDLGERLIDLPAESLKRLPLPDDLREAVEAARSMGARGARRRQVQFVGQIMRGVDEEPIRAALERLGQLREQGAEEFQEIEVWRARLIAEGESALPALAARWPAADLDDLRPFVNRAAADAKAGRGPASSRVLFRRLRKLAEDSGEE